MIIDTKLDIEHLELIKIFMKANDLVGVVITETPVEIRGKIHTCLSLESTVESTSVALTFMGIRHSGILNMLDDYLLKCGVPPDALQPATIYRQLQEERESDLNKDFMENIGTHVYPRWHSGYNAK